MLFSQAAVLSNGLVTVSKLGAGVSLRHGSSGNGSAWHCHAAYVTPHLLPLSWIRYTVSNTTAGLSEAH